MDTKDPIACPNCERLQAELDSLREQLAQVQAVVASLQQQIAAARKNSSTSSKPPSSDIVKPPRPSSSTPGKPGARPGHQRHQRSLFPAESLSAVFDHRIDVCPDCGHDLHATGFSPLLVQQVDLPAPKLHIEEHRCHETFCPSCQKAFRGSLPRAVASGGLLGPRLTTLVGYLKGVCHASFSTVRKVIRDVAGLTVSRGFLAKVINKVSCALSRPYEELLESLPAQARLNVDETSHKNNGELMWTWCFRAELYTLFKIDPTRSADVLLDVLGDEFDGVLGSDCFSAYRKYMRLTDVRVQFCLAHLVRDVKYLATLPDARERAYGERLREALRELFRIFHSRENYPDKLFVCLLQHARASVLRCGTENVPATKAAQAMAKRLTNYGESYFEFITTPEIAPTNNLAEQAIRFVVIDRHITQGTRSEEGQRWCERIWTTIATCEQTGQSVWEYLEAAVRASFAAEEAPSLLATGG